MNQILGYTKHCGEFEHIKRKTRNNGENTQGTTTIKVNFTTKKKKNKNKTASIYLMRIQITNKKKKTHLWDVQHLRQKLRWN